MESKLDEKKSEIATIQDKVHQKQELVDDFKMSEQRCQNQKLQIAKLEQRIDELMSAQRESAENIAECEFTLHVIRSLVKREMFSECSIVGQY